MRSPILDEFEERQSDLDHIIELTKFLNEGNTIVIRSEKGKEIDSFQYGDKTLHILNGVINLMSYNQVESTMRGCLLSIYDDISDNRIKYDELKREIQKEILKGILKNFDGNTSDKLRNKLSTNINLSLPSASLNIRKVFNGNIRAKTIYDIADKYSIIINSKADDREGTDITDLLKARNDLAHGNISFSEFGENNTYTETVNRSGRSSSYLRSVITAFNDYISAKGYKS